MLDARNGRTVSFVDGVARDLEPNSDLPSNIGRLIERARKAPMDRPEPALGLIVVDGVVHMAAVSAITPENPTEEQLKQADRPVILLTNALDSQLLTRAGREFALQGLRYEPNMAPSRTAALSINGPDGNSLGFLVWRDDKPGDDLLWRLLPALGLALLAMTYLLYIFFAARTSCWSGKPTWPPPCVGSASFAI